MEKKDETIPGQMSILDLIEEDPQSFEDYIGERSDEIVVFQCIANCEVSSYSIAEEQGKIRGADYMVQRFFDVLRTEIDPQESEDKEWRLKKQ